MILASLHCSAFINVLCCEHKYTFNNGQLPDNINKLNKQLLKEMSNVFLLPDLT